MVPEAVEYVPAAHFEHVSATVAPVPVENVPALQSLMVLFQQYVPALQTEPAILQ